MARSALNSYSGNLGDIMAITHVKRTKGIRPSKFVLRKTLQPRMAHSGQRRPGNYGSRQGEPENKIGDFMLYSEPDENAEDQEIEEEVEEDENDGGGYIALGGFPRHPSRISYPQRKAKTFHQKYATCSTNVVDYFTKRSQGLNPQEHQSVNAEFGIRHMLSMEMFREKEICRKDINKVFSSQWLSSHQIVMGTKCNKLLVYNIKNKKTDTIPSLSGSEPTRLNSQQNGIHTIQLNPSKTLLATSAQNSKNLAIYRLPTLDPVCVGEKAQSEFVFDTCWLDDQFNVSCSTDGKLALWRIDNDGGERLRNFEEAEYQIPEVIKPVEVKKCRAADKLKSIIYNSNLSEIVALSTNTYIHVWDVNKFNQKMSKKLPHSVDSICLAQREDCSMYAIGSKSHFTLLDPRTLHHIKKVNTKTCSRSISFRGDILTIGTGTGSIMFYDMRAGKYMESCVTRRAVTLKTTKGYVDHDENFHEHHHNAEYRTAFYTHCYDWSGIRLFAAGGPLPVSSKGNYAALWC